MKILLFLTLASISFSSFAKDFNIIHITGAFFRQAPGYFDPYQGESKQIKKYYAFTHHVPRIKLARVLSGLSCESGLILVSTSWGSAKANWLGGLWKRKCGAPADFFGLIDGIHKPTLAPFLKTPNATNCLNFYQNLSTLHGAEINGCDNYNQNFECTKAGAVQCHMKLHKRNVVNRLMGHIKEFLERNS